MKLLNITNRYYIIIALVLLLVSSAFLAYRVVYIVDNEISEHMLYEKLEIEKQLALQEDLQNIHFIIGDRLEIQPIPKFSTFRVTIKDTTIYDLYEKKKVPFRSSWTVKTLRSCRTACMARFSVRKVGSYDSARHPRGPRANPEGSVERSRHRTLDEQARHE